MVIRYHAGTGKETRMTDRRRFLGLASLGAASVALAPEMASAADAAPAPGAGVPAGVRVPRFELLYECDATLLPALDFGKTPEGQRRIIPITGGTIKGPQIRGQVVSGGYDWNLQRSDTASTVEAAYYLKTDDGVFIRVVNKGVSSGGPPSTDASSGELFFMFTHPSFEAPIGSKYEWLNRAMFVGTLGARKDAKDAVLIRVFRLV
jgi:hypothetical protein